MWKVIFLTLIFCSPSVGFAQKNFLDKVTLNMSSGYSSPAGHLSTYNSGSVSVNLGFAYDVSNNTQAIVYFNRTSFGFREEFLKPNIPVIYSATAGLKHNFTAGAIIPFVEAGGGLSILKKINDSGIPDREYGSLPVVYAKTGGAINLSENISFSAGVIYNRIFRNLDYEFLTYEGGLQFRLN